MIAAPCAAQRVSHLAQHRGATPPGRGSTPPLARRLAAARPRTGASPASTRSPPGRAQPEQGRRDRAQRDERQVGDHDVDRGRRGRRASRWRTLVRSRTSTRGSVRRRSWSWPRPTSTATTPAAPRCRQAVGEPAGRGAGVEHRAGRSRSTAKRSRAASSFSPPRPTKRGAGPASSTGSAAPTSRAALVGPRRSPSPAGGDGLRRLPGSRPAPAAPARRRGAGALSPAQDMPERKRSRARTGGRRSALDLQRRGREPCPDGMT